MGTSYKPIFNIIKKGSVLSILFSISHSCKLRGLKSYNMTVMRKDLGKNIINSLMLATNRPADLHTDLWTL